MSRDNRPYYMGQRPTDHGMCSDHSTSWYLNGKTYTIKESENTFSGVTYEPMNTSFLYWFMSNPYRFGFYFLLGMCTYLLFFR